MTSEPTPAEDLKRLASDIWRKGVQPNAVQVTAERLAWLAGRMTRILMPITTHYDWDRLRVNVAHKVEPRLVKWSGK